MMGEAVGVGHSLEQLVERLKKRYDPEIDTKILNVYLSGSRFVLPLPPRLFAHPCALGSSLPGECRVYGTANAESDWDYIIVTNQHTTSCFVEGTRSFFTHTHALDVLQHARAEFPLHWCAGADGERWTPDLPFPPSNNLDVYEDPEMNFDVSFITVEHFTILVCLAPLTQSSHTLQLSHMLTFFLLLRQAAGTSLVRA